MRAVGWVVVWGMLGGLAWGQDAARLQFFACGTVRFFGEACVPEPRTPMASSPVVPSLPPPTLPVTRPEPLPAPASTPTAPPEALFTPDTMAPGTPPLLLRLLHEPTAANAQAFLDWQRARLARILEVQRLLQQLGQAQGRAGQKAGERADRASSAAGPATGAPPCADALGAGGRKVCALRQP